MIMMAKWYWGTLGAQSFPTFVLQVRKNPEKTSPRKLVPTGDRIRARCVTGAHAAACPTAVDYNNGVLKGYWDWILLNFEIAVVKGPPKSAPILIRKIMNFVLSKHIKKGHKQFNSPSHFSYAKWCRAYDHLCSVDIQELCPWNSLWLSDNSSNFFL